MQAKQLVVLSEWEFTMYVGQIFKKKQTLSSLLLSFCVMMQVCQLLPTPADHFPVGSTMTTVHLSSDGTYFYWIWSPASLNEKTPKGHSVFMDVFELIVSAVSKVVGNNGA